MVFLTLFAIGAVALQGQTGSWKTGPEVGQKVPGFELVDQAGTRQTLESLMGRKGLMLAFVRSADW